MLPYRLVLICLAGIVIYANNTLKVGIDITAHIDILGDIGILTDKVI